jgi:D-glycero-beta-D-manno-heptose-7-phosphate kinase
MNHLSPERAEQILNAARGKKIAVLGDFMLDRHLKGTVRRISPEAPVPVVEVDTEMAGLGGAGNVAQNLASLGAIPICFGVVGPDQAGQTLLDLLKSVGAPVDGMLSSEGRKTTEKIRIIAHDQHVVRADRESTDDLSREEENRLLGSLESMAGSLDALILQDYNKGVLTASVIAKAITLAKAHHVPVSVDPKFQNFFAYSHVHLFKPNVKELGLAMGMSVADDAHFIEAGHQIFDRIMPEFLLITRGEKGMSLFLDHKKVQHIPTRAMKVHDVSGAGDTVIATFVAAEAGGATPSEAATLANYAAGVVCGEVGVVPIDRQRLIEVISSHN